MDGPPFSLYYRFDLIECQPIFRGPTAGRVDIQQKLPTQHMKVDDLFEETLAAQTIQKAVQPLEANHFESHFPWEVAQTLLPKAHLATTASGQRLPGLSPDARLAASDQGRA